MVFYYAVPPSPRSPTNSLRIDRFLRPFTLKAVQELLGKTGTVTSFWMDHIKTHCYVSVRVVVTFTATTLVLFAVRIANTIGCLSMTNNLYLVLHVTGIDEYAHPVAKITSCIAVLIN